MGWRCIENILVLRCYIIDLLFGMLLREGVLFGVFFKFFDKRVWEYLVYWRVVYDKGYKVLFFDNFLLILFFKGKGGVGGVGCWLYFDVIIRSIFIRMVIN